MVSQSKSESSISRINVGFEVLTAVVMKRSIFWDITPCCPLKINVSEEHVATICRAKISKL
jgi:hypothetical protein